MSLSHPHKAQIYTEEDMQRLLEPRVDDFKETFPRHGKHDRHLNSRDWDWWTDTLFCFNPIFFPIMIIGLQKSFQCYHAVLALTVKPIKFKLSELGWFDGTWCSCRKPRVSSQNPHGSSQPSIYTSSRGSDTHSWLPQYCTHVHRHVFQAKHLHKIIINILMSAASEKQEVLSTVWIGASGAWNESSHFTLWNIILFPGDALDDVRVLPEENVAINVCLHIGLEFYHVYGVLVCYFLWLSCIPWLVSPTAAWLLYASFNLHNTFLRNLQIMYFRRYIKY